MTPRTGKILIGALVVSAAVNLFVAGGLVSMAMRGPWPFDHGPRMDRLDERLSPAGRELVHQAFDANRERVKKEAADVRVARQEIAAALEADPFDPARRGYRLLSFLECAVFLDLRLLPGDRFACGFHKAEAALE